MRKTILIRQHDITDCGSACLASVSAFYKLFIPIARIRQYAGTDQKGTNVLGLVEAAEKLGFQARGVRGDQEALSLIPLPAIVHMILENGLHHYEVLYKVRQKTVRLMDPATGKIEKMLFPDFLSKWSGVMVLLIPDESFRQEKISNSPAVRFWELIRPNRAIMFQTLAGAFVFSILGLSMSVYVQKIVDFVLVDGNIRLLNLLGLLMLVILIFQFCLGFAKSLLALRTGQHIDARLILGYYKHLMELPQKFFDTMRVGEIMSRLGDAAKIRIFINDVAVSILVNIFMILSSVSLMFIYYWKLALMMLLIFPLYTILYIISHYINKKWQLKLMQDSAELEAQLVESLQYISTIRQLNLEKHINSKTETHFIRLLRTIYTVSIKSLWLGGSSDFITKLFTVFILWAGSYYVINGELTPGELLSFYALIGYFTAPAVFLISANKMIQDAFIAARRLYEIIDLETENQDMALPKNFNIQKGDIEFRDVGFRYSNRMEIFNGLNFTIPQGSCTAIIGESGSGKSTLMYLLQQLYPLSSGQILIGSMDIRTFHTDHLRNLIGVVPQRTDIFSGTVSENITIGFPDPDISRMLEITKALEIHDFISELPQGYNSVIGEKGMNLSGGQAQRIAIARALFRNPDILILDEPTSALDLTAEKIVMKVLNAFCKENKTVVIITHRPAAIAYCSKTIKLEKGRIAEYVMD